MMVSRFVILAFASLSNFWDVVQASSETVVEVGVSGDIDHVLETEETDTKPFFVAIPKFLSSEKCAKYRSFYIDPKSTRNHDNLILVGEIPVDDEDVVKLIETFDQIEGRPELRAFENVTQGVYSPRKALRAKHTYLMRSSDLHQDFYTEGVYNGKMVTGNNAFIFLDSNPDARFEFNHGKTTVPAEEGTLLIFSGNTWHQTFVEKGSIHLLGPMDTDYLVTVGFSDDVPSAMPTETPSATPSEVPSSMPAPPDIPCPCGNGWFAFFFCRLWRFRVCAW